MQSILYGIKLQVYFSAMKLKIILKFLFTAKLCLFGNEYSIFPDDHGIIHSGPYQARKFLLAYSA